jgi:Fe-S-cluster containining protein
VARDDARQCPVPDRLAVIESCDGCGACCRVVTQPPFYNVFGEIGEDAWERLKADRPDLLAALVADYKARRASGGPFSGTPCFWFEPKTARCRHYEYRPLACREFEIGDVDCLDARRRAGISLPRNTSP